MPSICPGGQVFSAPDSQATCAAACDWGVADKWRQSNRLLLERYKQWAAAVVAAGS